jgi:hypothetical protein
VRSILNQLDKYQPPLPEVPTTPRITIHGHTHPYQKMVEELCDVTEPERRKEIINRALLALNDFAPPPMSGQLYPLESAVLYHLFYRHQIQLCGEARADSVLGAFLREVMDRDGLNDYMATLRHALDKTAGSIFLTG